MATRSVSPGGALLRSSRMFSLPKAIPQPTADKSGSTPYNSATATLCHPTHQVITTMASARKQGDWGLKRPLPLKSTTNATHAMLRVRAIDTIEHITDYTSATEHGITLKKFQELNLPITMRPPGNEFNVPQKSVFENQLDVTDIHPDKRAETMDSRWQFSGPWLAGMTQGEFKDWLVKEVRPKRSEFRIFLKKQIASEMDDAASAKAMDEGQAPPPPTSLSAVAEDQLIQYLRKLRNNPQALYDMYFNKDSTGLLHGREIRYPRNPYAADGPPKTHPSAGISYLRTNMFVENHPIYGPQKTHAPVQARVVRPRRQAQGMQAKLGVAGFIADVPGGESDENNKSTAGTWVDRKYDRLDPKIKGGAKTWVEPVRASIDSNGQVIIIVKPGDPQAVCVAQELLGDMQVLGVEREVLEKDETSHEIRQKYRARDAPAMSSARDYGLNE
ncbi:hypothetical protein N0V88_005133 [Collariella sp. IMI 366227]|nr:hypothetical protein N0V88_005133 [Collariella sp. IMI 366227]